MRTGRRLSTSRHGCRAVRPAATALIGLMVVLTACDPTPRERRAIQRWLLCDECSDGELDSVVAAARRNRVVDALGDALNGPPVAGRENIRLQTQAMYERIPSPLVPQAEFVQHFVDNYVATYQSRAAIALGRIGTPRARAFLLEAVRNDSIPYRDDVLRELGTSAHLSLTPVDTTPQSAPVDSFVRINPAVKVSDLSDSVPQPLGNVRVVFQVESGGGVVLDSIQRTDESGKATARWQLGPGVDSVNVLRAVAAGQIVQFRATGRGPGYRVVFAVQPSNALRGEAIQPPVRIAIVDPWDQPVPTFNGTAELRVIGTSTAVTTHVVAGVASFPDVRVGSPGTGFRILVAVGGAGDGISQPFNILP